MASTRSVLALSPLLLAVFAGVGCASDVEPATFASAGLYPKVAHSGFGGGATFRVMFATSGKNPEWSVADPTIATIAPSPPPSNIARSSRDLSFGIVTTLRAGETTVNMKSGGTTVTATLKVREYTAEQLAAGKARYETPTSDPVRRPCAGCHAINGVDHSPLKMAGFDDAVVLGVIQEATYPASARGQSSQSDFAPTGPLKPADGIALPHKWDLSEPEKDGILSHLRSLPLGGL